MKTSMKILSAFILAFFCTFAFGAEERETIQSAPGMSPLIEAVDDPLEPVNRGMEQVNAGLNEYLVHPVGTVYNFLLPKFVRTGIGNFGTNLGYPLRVVNNCLQGKWDGAWDETKRFGINTTVGVLGVWDAAGKFGIKPSNEDFGQTFGHYGVGPGWYLHIPLMGPTNTRDCLGSIIGIPFNVGFWLMPTDTYRVVNGVGMLNGAFDKSTFIKQYFAVNYDTYPMTRAMYSLSREDAVTDYVAPMVESAPEQSFGFMRLTPADEHFFEMGFEHRIRIPGALRQLRYSCWKGSDARTIVILPGIGGHRLTTGVVALAELFNQQGWNVITLSSTLHPDFFLGMPNGRFPGDFSFDIPMIDSAISLALKDFARRHGACGECTVLGYSLGALDALNLAAAGTSFECRRFIAINPPRRPLAALEKIDEFFAIPAGWGDGVREERSAELYHRLASLYLDGNLGGGLPVTYEESCLLIGINMRLPLMDLLFAQYRENGSTPGGDVGKNLAATMSFTWKDYAEKCILPEHCSANGVSIDADELARKFEVDAIADKLRDDDRVRLFHNENDFLLRDGDIEWYRGVFGERTTIFPAGSHLGNIFMEEYRKALLEAAK